MRIEKWRNRKRERERGREYERLPPSNLSCHGPILYVGKIQCNIKKRSNSDERLFSYEINYSLPEPNGLFRKNNYFRQLMRWHFSRSIRLNRGLANTSTENPACALNEIYVACRKLEFGRAFPALLLCSGHGPGPGIRAFSVVCTTIGKIVKWNTLILLDTTIYY